MADISKYIRDLYKDSAELSDLVGILQELVDRIEALEAQQKAAFKLGRKAGLEEAKQKCVEAGTPQPDEIHTDAQWAAKVLATQIESLKDNTP